MKLVTKKQLLEIANEMAQQQDEYFEGLILDGVEVMGGNFIFTGQGFSDGKGNVNIEKWALVELIIKKIEPVLRANYIIVG
ncbi:DUF2498 family protein [Acinetobacter baumannii]|uniref:DUF2498 family protein n=1 Tax=Acinetobacter baumannii TaxID=470 RepID=UPI002956AD07|nr:DUF2498 family protein [Acinetobacter baumannii]